jgi:phosphohistidine phosphatase
MASKLKLELRTLEGMIRAMELYILRHAIALSCSEAGVQQDSERPLSAEGKEKMKKIASAMWLVGVEVDLVLSSPYVRARETALMAHEGLGLKDRLEFSDALASGAETKGVLEELKRQFKKHERIMVVGHEPDLSALIGKVTSLGRLRVEMKKAGLAKIEITETNPELKGTLEFLLTPKVMLHVK